MRKSIGIVLVLLLVSGGVSAQNYNAKITGGAIAEQQQKYGDAIEKLEDALAHQDMIKKSKNIAKAYYHLYRSYYVIGSDTSKKELRAKYPEALFQAKENLQKFLNHPDASNANKNSIKLSNGEQNLGIALYSAGVDRFNSQTDYPGALKYFNAADEMNPDHFLTNRMLGSTHIILEDTSNSVNSLKRCLEIYNKKYVAPENAEEIKAADAYYQINHGQMSYIYQQLAVIYQAKGETRNALDLLSEGTKLLPDDESIKRQELAIYQQNPELLEEAEKKFQEAMDASPDDASIKLAYAALLDKASKGDKALALYQKVYDSDKNNLQANYGIGAYYINKAAEMSNEKMKLTKDAEIEAMDKQIVELVGKAYPYMVWLHEKQPEETEWLRQLITITPILGKDEEMMKYGEKLSALNKK